MITLPTIYRTFFYMSLTLLTACSMTQSSEKKAYCNALKSDMVFNGSTSITREANIQATELPLQQRSYDLAGCED